MVSNSILIDLLPKEEKRKTKIHKLIVVLAITILAISISVIGVFFISQKKVLACHCGDGSVNQPSEQCDTTIPQACIINGYNGLKNCVGCLWSNCIPNESCGDGITNGNEQCDDGNSNNLDGCRNNCTLLYCGDGILDNGEQCDDGNTVNGDGCSATCDLEQTGPVCGNGIIESGEQCDDSNTINGDGCSATCQLEQNPPACSDGHLDAGEQCDDGNIIDGDGCSANCTIEKGTLTVCKYNDVNKNGVYDVATDTPLVWNMTIINPGGSTTTAQTSATSGCVSLADLPYGTYSVQEEDKTNWLRSFPSVNPTQAIISSTSIDMLINFLNYEQEGPGPEYGSITVCKLIDQDGLASTTNDRYEATTTLWSFNLISQTSTTTKTTASGTNCVVFDNLLAGDYQVNEILNSGWQLIDPEQNSINVNLTAAENKNFTFINSALVVPLKGKIFGYKYNDANNNGIIDSSEQKMSSWLMQLIACPYTPLGTSTIQFLPNSRWQTASTSSIPEVGQCTIIATTTTDSTGYYEFANLSSGDYGISEVVSGSWTQTYPANDNFYYFNLAAGEIKPDINFANYQPGEVPQPRCGDGRIDAGEQCDDGNNVNGDGCNSSCTTESHGGGGGGGGYLIFNIYDPAVSEQNCETTVTWRTNMSATSRVFYDVVSHSTSTAPSSDYKLATTEEINKVTGHTVIIPGLQPNTTYYFRVYSEGTIKKYSEEVTYTTSATVGQCGSTVVKGEEGKPSLKIAKSVNIDFANPGQEGIEYLIIVSNAGNLVAYNVKLVDTLPTGLSYADDSPSKRNWDLGDIKPGESKSITYQVNVSQNARAMFYENVAEATAANQDQPVKSTVKLDVRTIRVLAATGFSLVEFIIMISALIILVGLSIFLRKKMA